MSRKIPAIEAMARIYEALEPLDPDARQRVIGAVLLLLNGPAKSEEKVEPDTSMPAVVEPSVFLVR